MNSIKLSQEDLKWRTDCDVRTIESYMELCADEERNKLAYDALAEKKANIETVLATAAANKAMNAAIRGHGQPNK